MHVYFGAVIISLLSMLFIHPNSSWPLFTKQTSYYGYRNPNYKLKMVWQPSQVCNGNPSNNKTVSSLRIPATGATTCITTKHVPWAYFLGCAVKTHCTLQWRHNERDGVWNHQPRHCLLTGLFRPRSKKTSKFRVTGLCVGNSPRWPVNSPHKGPVTRKMFPFDDVIMGVCHL